jgi:hypothetical protein
VRLGAFYSLKANQYDALTLGCTFRCYVWLVQAALCVPLLDPVGCVFHALAIPLSDQAAASVLSFLLRNSSGQELDDVISALVDLWRFGDSAAANSVASRTDTSGSLPKPWWTQYHRIHETLASSKAAEQQSGPIADTMMRWSFGSQGWVPFCTSGGRLSIARCCSSPETINGFDSDSIELVLDADGATVSWTPTPEPQSSVSCFGKSLGHQETRRSSRSFGSLQPPGGSRVACLPHLLTRW